MPSETKPLVTIRCLVYNHEDTIRQCLDGFVMQQTDFPFEAVVHDDASTDASASIIREYAERYPDIIKPILETENQYSKGGGVLKRIMDEATRGIYVALCEGDDAWLDPLKLQKQINYLEGHPDCSMVCSDAVIRTEQGDLTEADLNQWHWPRYHESRDASVADLILNGGWFLHTASIIYRRELREDYPEACKKCNIGDWPLQIFMGLKGKVHYFAEKMVLYRFAMGNSWTARDLGSSSSSSPQKHFRGWKSQLDMLESLDDYSKRLYHFSFRLGAAHLVSRMIQRFPLFHDPIIEQFGYVLRRSYIPAPETEEERKALQHFRREWKAIRSRASHTLRFCGIPLVSCIRDKSGTTRRLLGIKVWQKEIGEKAIVRRFLGIPVHRRSLSPP